MEFEDFKLLAKSMRAAYTKDNFLPDMYSIKLFYQMLKDLPYDALSAAVQQHMSVSDYPPTIASLRRAATEVTHGAVPDWSDGWEIVLKAVRNYGSYREAEAMEAIAEKDPLAAEAVKRLGFLTICFSEDLTPDRANFRQIYMGLAQRKAQADVLPDGLKERIAQIGTDKQKMLEG